MVVVSADIGAGKPDPRVFERALAGLGADTAVMVGDSLERDVRGALAAGLRAVWVNRAGRPLPAGLGVPQISTLAQLPSALAQLDGVEGELPGRRRPALRATFYSKNL